MNWHEYYFKRSLSLIEREGSEVDFLVAAHGTMTPENQEKVNKVLASSLWADPWLNAVMATIRAKKATTLQQIAAIMLDGIDQYINSSMNTARPDRVRLTEKPRGKQGEVSPAEVASRRLTPWHSSVWQGSTSDAPSIYPYVYVKLRNKYLHNPNYVG